MIINTLVEYLVILLVEFLIDSNFVLNSSNKQVEFPINIGITGYVATTGEVNNHTYL